MFSSYGGAARWKLSTADNGQLAASGQEARRVLVLSSSNVEHLRFYIATDTVLNVLLKTSSSVGVFKLMIATWKSKRIRYGDDILMCIIVNDTVSIALLVGVCCHGNDVVDVRVQ